MAIPNHVDDRALNRFRRGFVGSSHGDNGSAYRDSWNSQCDAEPSKMIMTSGRPICAYCGNTGLPLQPNIDRYGDYDIVGYTCVCTGAMDEEEWERERCEMENNHHEERRALERRKPKTNPDVIKGIIHALTAQLAEATELQDVRRILAKIQKIREEDEDEA